MKQKIIGFHQDSENHWVADLNCGHKQHVRHDPPLVERPWVLNEKTRQEKLGIELNCKLCDEWGREISRQVIETCLATLEESLQEAGMSGLCKEGQYDLVRDRIKNLDLAQIYEKVILEKLME